MASKSFTEKVDEYASVGPTMKLTFPFTITQLDAHTVEIHAGHGLNPPHINFNAQEWGLSAQDTDRFYSQAHEGVMQALMAVCVKFSMG